MRILLVEDEALTRAELRYVLLKLEPTLTLFEAGSAPAALTLAQAEAPHAALLDVTLPGSSGLELASDLLELNAPPLLVFTTAHRAHALAAFDLAAVDYLVKPYREARVAQTLGRLHAAKRPPASRPEQESPALNRLWAARPGGGGILLDYAEVCWVEADGRAVYAQTQRGTRYALKERLRELETRLSPHGFVRTHKSYLVNLAHVTELEPWFSGAYLLRVADAKSSTVPLSRQYAKALRARTGWL